MTLGKTLNPQIAPAGIGMVFWSGFREPLPSSRPHEDSKKASQGTSNFSQWNMCLQGWMKYRPSQNGTDFCFSDGLGGNWWCSDSIDRVWGGQSESSMAEYAMDHTLGQRAPPSLPSRSQDGNSFGKRVPVFQNWAQKNVIYFPCGSILRRYCRLYFYADDSHIHLPQTVMTAFIFENIQLF